MIKHWSQNYYANQAGNGMSGFQGVRYQRGHGFFGSIFSKVLKPLAKYLGRQAISTGVDLGRDVLEGNNFKKSALNRLKQTGNKIFDDGTKRAKVFMQTGKGRKRKYRSKNVVNTAPKNKKRKSKKKKAAIKKKSAKKKKQLIKIRLNKNKNKSKKSRKSTNSKKSRNNKKRKASFRSKSSKSEQLNHLFE